MTDSYKGNVSTVLHHINMMVQRDWSSRNPNAFEDETKIQRLAELSGMSCRNLQLYFHAYTNETVGKYKNRIRLEYALQLLKEGRYTHSEISERVGLANDTALYNIFRKKLDSTPAEYKASFLTDPILHESSLAINCKMIDLPETHLLFLSYIGDYGNYTSAVFEERSWSRLYDYAQKRNLLPEIEEYWGICFDDKGITEDDKCRFYAAISINAQVKPKFFDEIKYMPLSPSRYAVYTYKGSYSQLDNFYSTILQNIPAGYKLGEGLILERYLNSVADMPEAELLTEILLPIEKLT